MPKPGFKSFTITDFVYDTFYETYLKCKDELKMEGIRSFSAYITSMINECMEVDKIITKYRQRYEKIAIEESRIIIKDNEINRVVELARKGSVLYCQFCKRNNCVHVGFCYSLHQIYG